MSRNNVVYFAHGKESGPWGLKIKALAKIAEKAGFEVESPDYQATVDPDKRVEMLLELKPTAEKNLVLVGSSMGAYVSAVASSTLQPQGLFLMAPAVYIPFFKHLDPRPTALETFIIHAWNDEIIPVENAIKYAQQYQVPLYLVKSNHALSDQVPLLESLFSMFLERILQKD